MKGPCYSYLEVMPTVYLTGPVKGVSYGEATAWRDRFADNLKTKNIICFSPLRFREDQSKRPTLGHQPGDKSPRASVHRDLFDVKRCDLVFANFLSTEITSFGSVFELGYAYALQKPVVLCIDKASVYDHCFLTETSGFIVHSEYEALEIIESILNPGRDS